MSALAFTQLFLFFLFSTLLTRFWLAARQWRNVNRHRDEVPEQFAGNITLDAHRKAADYTLAKIRFSLIALVVDTIVLVGFTIGGASSAACSSGWLEEMDTPAFPAHLEEKKPTP